jgi:hypothetical protein
VPDVKMEKDREKEGKRDRKDRVVIREIERDKES